MIMAPIPDCMKKGEFNSSKAVTNAFKKIKRKMTEAPVMRLSDF